MKKTHLAFVVAVVLAAVGYYIYQRTAGGDHVALDLFDAYEQVPVENRRSVIPDKSQAYHHGPETIAGQTKRGIYMHPTSRLVYSKVTVPDNGRLRGFVAVKEEAWTQDGSDGVLFRFGVSDGRDYFELLNQHVDPRHNANDRGWLPIDVDLSAYAGQQVDLVFNTNSSLPKQGDNSAYDFAVWGEPAVIERP
jgi:hypothetical protein